MVISSLTCCGGVTDLRQTAAIPHLRVAKKGTRDLLECICRHKGSWLLCAQIEPALPHWQKAGLLRIMKILSALFQQLTGCKNEEHIVRRASSKHILRLLPQERELQEFREVRTDKGRT